MRRWAWTVVGCWGHGIAPTNAYPKPAAKKRVSQLTGGVQVKPVINAMGTMTSLGGSKLHPAAIQAMKAISTTFVDLNHLLRSAGRQVGTELK